MAATVLGRYELLRLLGRGGMADVYLARRRVAGLEKRLVIKRVRPQKPGDTTFLELFVREARLSMTLNHQNIVPVFDFGRVGDAAFLAMEHVEGRDLGATLGRAAAPPPPLLCAFIAAECCRALDHAHRRKGPDGAVLGVVHRDVTPRNVLLSWAGEVKLTDFGVAALAGDPGGDVRGTIAYMAPEQARYEPTDARADLYGLGLVLWEMLTGKRVRRGLAKAELLELTRSGGLPPLPEGPPGLVSIVERATQREPGARFADAAAMLEALDRDLVDARAAAPGPAPALQLADWLVTVWSSDAGKDEGEPLDAVTAANIEADLDPATMRSLAETAAESGELAALAEPPPLPPPRVEKLALPSPPPARRYLPAALLVGAAALVALVVFLTNRPRSPSSATSTPALADAASVAPASADAAAATDAAAAVAIDAPAVIPTTPDAAASPLPIADARRPTPDAASATADATVTVLTRKVTIGATPWADFTVDDDPTPHQTPETISLSPGPHRIHFTNAPLGVTRTVTIDVPADRDIKHVEPLEPQIAPRPAPP